MLTLGPAVRRHALQFLRFHSTGSQLLIYGANTDVGKTVVSAALCHYGLSTGHAVTYIKPVQTGSDTDADAILKQLCNLKNRLATETLFHYPSPESPASAAEKAGVTQKTTMLKVGKCKRVTICKLGPNLHGSQTL